eukprot:CAMPEP_0180468218 /NCGR_PEP_ID=MMETSP1036_2-20121128/27404_1 /TAXON_ID=632150 /ORGANISM="Azadinium spinosum, Strain 3D9" /LENGTH=42 /DNA_ID= /DNA_START= /DNA_END= /DNA_ORIENTATION=
MGNVQPPCCCRGDEGKLVELDAPILHVASGDPAGAGQEEAGG